MSANSPPSRRTFVLTSAAVFLGGGDKLRAFVNSAGVSTPPTTLQSRAQYISDSLTYEAAMRDLASAARLAVDTTAAKSRFVEVVASASVHLDLQHSWMVAQCLADANLERWVRRTVRDEPSFNAFVSRLQQDPRALNTVAEVSALSTRLAALKSEKVRIVESVLTKACEVAGMSSAVSSAATRADDAQECEKTWAIVTAVLTVVVAVVVAVSPRVVSSGVTLLATTYEGTGADRAYSAAQAAERAYRQCATAASTLPPAPRAQAVAACQLRWLESAGPR